MTLRDPTARAGGRAAPRQVLAMLKVGAVGFGGGSALIPVMAKELVTPRLLTEEQFTQDTVIANITPGALPVKLAALAGGRLQGTRLATASALAVALPGTLATLALLAGFDAVGPAAVELVELASLGITAFILYLLGHYVLTVLAPSGRPRPTAIVVAVVAFLVSGAGRTMSLGSALMRVESTGVVPELSALGLVLASLAAIAVLTAWQALTHRRVREGTVEPTVPGTDTPKGGVRAAVGSTALAAVGFLIAAQTPVTNALSLMALVLLSTLSSFGGGEAYVGVADGFFVASGIIDSSVFYGQIVPVANALPGPILVKIAVAVSWVVGAEDGPVVAWQLAGAAMLVTVGSCGAIALTVLAGYQRLRYSRLVRNISAHILPVICGLLGATAVSMLHSSVRIAEASGLSGSAAVVGTVMLAVSVPVVRRVTRVPDAIVIVLFGGLGALLGLLA